MDRPIVNVKFYEKLLKVWEETELPNLNIDTCLYVYMVLWCNRLGYKKVLKGGFQILHDSPARKEDYVRVTELDILPLPTFMLQDGWKTRL